MTESSDNAQLVRAAAAGDLGAYEALVEAERARVLRIARRLVGSVEDAKDVVQLVFIRLWKVLRRYDVEGSFDAWLYRITTNVALDLLRARSRRRESGLTDGAVADLHGAGGAAVADPLAAGAERDIQRIYRELLAELAPKQRAAFTLKELEGLTTAETARVLGTRPSTVRNHVLQARRVLRRRLRERFPEYHPARGDAPRAADSEAER